MFINFFYLLRDNGIRVSPTSFLTFQKALSLGLVNSIDDVYTTARTILVKSEKYFDTFDQIFAHHFHGVELVDLEEENMEEMAHALLNEWLQNPKELADALGIPESELSKLSPDELIEYFKKRLEDQNERHDGGNKWIGTGGTSPVGHSGVHPGGMRVGGSSRNKSAVKVAMERRYRDYSTDGPLTESMMSEALRRLRNMIPSGPKDELNIDESIYQTVKNGGEIELIFDKRMKDKLKIFLFIDNGGWSMDPHIPVVQLLFDHSKSQFKDIKTFYFHNTIYGKVWEDPGRLKKPIEIDNFTRFEKDTRLIFVGDASMAPYELMGKHGSLYYNEKSGKSSFERLKFLSKTFPHAVWLNPLPKNYWPYTETVCAIREFFPMFELSLDGLEKAVSHLMSK